MMHWLSRLFATLLREGHNSDDNGNATSWRESNSNGNCKSNSNGNGNETDGVEAMSSIPFPSCPSSLPTCPQHIAFIMDGNRRYAKEKHWRSMEGHSSGYDKLKETLEWCNAIGVRMVSVYAFSIDNFNRSEDEVNNLMKLAQEKFVEMIKRRDIIEQYGCSVRVLGDVSLLPPDVRSVMSDAVASSRHQSNLVLNICMPYSHQMEMLHATELVGRAVREGILTRQDVDSQIIRMATYTGISASMTNELADKTWQEATSAQMASKAAESTLAAASSVSHPSTTAFSSLSSALSSAISRWLPFASSRHSPTPPFIVDDSTSPTQRRPSPPPPPPLSPCPDLLIRTSGETRLSDFLCLQSSFCPSTRLSFLDELWPDLSMLSFGIEVARWRAEATVRQQERWRREERERWDRERRDRQIVRKIIQQEQRAQQRKKAMQMREQMKAKGGVSPEWDSDRSNADIDISPRSLNDPSIIMPIPRSPIHQRYTLAPHHQRQHQHQRPFLSACPCPCPCPSSLTTSEESGSDGSDDGINTPRTESKLSPTLSSSLLSSSPPSSPSSPSLSSSSSPSTPISTASSPSPTLLHPHTHSTSHSPSTGRSSPSSPTLPPPTPSPLLRHRITAIPPHDGTSTLSSAGALTRRKVPVPRTRSQLHQDVCDNVHQSEYQYEEKWMEECNHSGDDNENDDADADADASMATCAIEEAELQQRLNQYQEERAKRIRSFTHFLTKHTPAFV